MPAVGRLSVRVLVDLRERLVCGCGSERSCVLEVVVGVRSFALYELKLNRRDDHDINHHLFTCLRRRKESFQGDQSQIITKDIFYPV